MPTCEDEHKLEKDQVEQFRNYVIDAPIPLRRMLRNKWEYDGTMSLVLYILYAVLSIMMVRTHWDGKGAYGRHQVLGTFQSFGSGDSQSVLADTATMQDAAEHMIKYVQVYANTSSRRGLRGNSLFVTEYVQVKFARIIVNVAKNCRNLNGYRLMCDAKLTRTAVDDMINNTTGGWHNPGSTIMGFRMSNPGKRGWVSTVLVAQGSPVDAKKKNITREELQERITGLLNDTAYIGRNAYAVTLELVGVNRLNNQDITLYTLSAQRATDRYGSPGPGLYWLTSAIQCRLPPSGSGIRNTLFIIWCIYSFGFAIRHFSSFAQSSSSS